MFGKRDIITEDIGKGGIPILAFEGRGAEQHLVDQYTQSPPIHGACVTATFDDLGRNIFLGANERVRPEICYTRFGVDCG